MILEALRRGEQGLTSDDVLHRIRSGKARYWSAPDAQFVTELEADGLHIWLGAGKREALFSLYLQQVEPWARRIGAGAITIDGRKGWLRFAEKFGFERVGECALRKVLT